MVGFARTPSDDNGRQHDVKAAEDVQVAGSDCGEIVGVAVAL